MALGSNVTADCENDRGAPSFPASFSSAWKTVIDAGGMDGLDNSGAITIPGTHITASDHHIFVREKWMGTYLIPRLAYATAAVVSAGGTVVCFGRKDSTDIWSLLRNKSGSLSTSFTCAPTTDAGDGTLSYTTPTLASDPIDTMGCNEFLFGVSAVHAADSTYATLAKLQVKVI